MSCEKTVKTKISTEEKWRNEIKVPILSTECLILIVFQWIIENLGGYLGKKTFSLEQEFSEAYDLFQELSAKHPWADLKESIIDQKDRENQRLKW